MGAIVDILFLDRCDISTLKNKYPDCVLINLTNTTHHIQQYRLIVQGEDQYDDSYYNFLFDNMIAMCSKNFQSRFENDESFKQRIRARADVNLREFTKLNTKPD